MPHKITVTVTSLEDGYIAPFTGGYIRGLFFTVLATFDEKLAKYVHDMKGIKPFAVEPLKPEGSKKKVEDGGWKIEKGKKYSFSFKLLHDETGKKFIEVLLNFDKLKIGKLQFALENISVTKTTYEELAKNVYLGRIGLTFLTPTYFNIKGKKFPYVLPDIRRIAANLLNIWNRYTNPNLKFAEESAIKAIEESTFIRAHEIKTREVEIEGIKQAGFKGKVEIIIDKENPIGAPFIVPLLHLAEYSNIGEKRTYGLGVVKTQKLK